MLCDAAKVTIMQLLSINMTYIFNVPNNFKETIVEWSTNVGCD